MTRPELPSDPLSWLRESTDLLPPEGAEARVAARVLASIGTASATPSAVGARPGAEPASPPQSAIRLLADRVVRWSLLPLGVGLGVGVYVAPGGEQLSNRPVLHAGLKGVSGLGVASVPRVPEPTPPLVETAAPRSASSVAPDSKGSLAAERDLLDRARRKLASGEPDPALGFLEQHARRFPRGQLSEEREAMWVNVLALLGRDREARARGRAFEERFPGSLMGSSVRAALRASDAAK